MRITATISPMTTFVDEFNMSLMLILVRQTIIYFNRGFLVYFKNKGIGEIPDCFIHDFSSFGNFFFLENFDLYAFLVACPIDAITDCFSRSV